MYGSLHLFTMQGSMILYVLGQPIFSNLGPPTPCDSLAAATVFFLMSVYGLAYQILT